MSIASNIEVVKTNINKSAIAANRNVDDIRLIAVSKTKPLPDLIDAYEAGCRDFGENKVQEIMDKYDNMPKDVRWHMIGHLQTNKVKYIVDKVYMIHSVDSYKLAEVISKEAVKKNVTVKILIEVNVAEEDSKFGVTLNNAEELIDQIIALPNIEICGLMTIAPYTVDSESNRQYFVGLKQLFVDVNSKKQDNIIMTELSMGMTGDYQVAIEEGATMVRVGTGIFGERNYSI